MNTTRRKSKFNNQKYFGFGVFSAEKVASLLYIGWRPLVMVAAQRPRPRTRLDQQRRAAW